MEYYVIQGGADKWKHSLIDGYYGINANTAKLLGKECRFCGIWGFKRHLDSAYQRLRTGDTLYLRSNVYRKERDFFARAELRKERDFFARAELKCKFRPEKDHWGRPGADTHPNRIVYGITAISPKAKQKVEGFEPDNLDRLKRLSDKGKYDQQCEELEGFLLFPDATVKGKYYAKGRQGSIVKIDAEVADSINHDMGAQDFRSP